MLLLMVPARAQQPLPVVRDTIVCDSLVWGDTVYRFGHSNPNYWTSVTLSDINCPDSILWNARIKSSTTIIDTAVSCHQFLWNGIHFTLPEGLHRLDIDTMLVGTNIAGCPSYRKLRLNLFGTDTTHLSAVACDQYHWDVTDEMLFDADDYSYLTHNQAGCDSVVLLHLNIVCSTVDYFADSICQGDIFRFYDRNLTVSGHYNENYISSVYPYCDSIIVLLLTVLPPPAITFDHWVDCREVMHHVVVNTPVDYLEWSLPYADPALDSQQHARELVVNPAYEKTFTLLADYLPVTTCPSTADITLKHIDTVKARMNIVPPRISMEELTFEARDISEHASGRDWYVDGEYYTSRRNFRYEADVLNDSVVLMLDAYGPYCHDTSQVVLQIHRSTTYTPNAFTPGQPTNSVFFFPWTGVSDFHASIFTRGGLLVWHTDDILQGWDGTHKGAPCPAGTYIWHVQYTDIVRPNNPQVLEGVVTLIR